MAATGQSSLGQPVTLGFTTAAGSVLGLQQSLAELGYLPPALHRYSFAVASKTLPETLTVWHDGQVITQRRANSAISQAPISTLVVVTG